MKKIIFVIFVALAAISLCACSVSGATDIIDGEKNSEKIPTEVGGSEESPIEGEEFQEPEEPELKTNEVFYVRSKVNSLAVRSGAGSGYGSLGTLDKGDMVAYLGEEDGWYRTVYRNRTAYVSAKSSYTDLYKMEKGGDTVEKVIEEGLKLLGTPYVYGATRYHDGAGKKLSGFSINKFDCSSLMQYIYCIGAGKNLSLTTRTQISQGKKIDTLKRGDLMFFTNASRKNNVGIERVGHVAMYLGDNYILHTASDHAVIEEISSTRWGYFIEARRII